ncbi:polysaccharide deacetylase family protein [Bacteroidota bacterium]
MIKKILSCCFLLLLVISCKKENENIGSTEIMKWQDGKKGAISLTYDDGSINQFRVALPLMDKRGFPATFYINTGSIPGSEFQAKFFGRPVEEIINETATVPTNKDNLFERASAVGYLGYRGLMDFHTRAGSAIDSEHPDIEKACQIIDEAYALVRAGKVEKREVNRSYSGRDRITWDEIKTIAVNGHEFGAHTISHPRLAILDEVNLLWELEKCKEDIENQLGPEHTFSAECPYGTENERVMEYAYEIFPVLRNRMPEDYLEELNRGNRGDPTASNKEYVQWQRGPLTNISIDKMKSWVDVCAENGNIWLVLVFHGVDGVGWEARTGEELDTYFQYMKDKEDDLWVATFKDVAKYIRERMNAEIGSSRERNAIKVKLKHSLDPDLYDLELTLKTTIPEKWESVEVKQGDNLLEYEIGNDQSGRFMMYQALANSDEIVITRSK